MKKATAPDPDHLLWLIEHRSDTQTVSANLYRLLNENQAKIDKSFGSQAQALVAISFSLWRSVFLSDKTGVGAATTADAEQFLGEMLQNNAIGYPQERTARDWTFNYYLANARYRLEELKRDWSEFRPGTLFPPKGERTPKSRWERLQRAFTSAVTCFDKRLKKSSKK